MMLSITNLQGSVADTPILRGLSLDVRAGEVHAFVGLNRAEQAKELI